jgi:predicted GTPase
VSTTVTLSLISHTNVGKTTLARTLLRRDVGEVADQAHVTEVAEAHALIETRDARLLLWDTPGFGDTRRLIDRLRRENAPLGWFLHQVWDRIADRPLFCSQRAVQNVKEEADVVLYLVNAAEDPQHAGYVAPELEILTWMERPVLLLLNQVGDEAKKAQGAWRRFAAEWPIVRGVLTLDAFSRCWVEEDVLLREVAGVLTGEKQEAMNHLVAAWMRYNQEIFEASCLRMAGYLARAAIDRENQRSGLDSTGALKVVSDLARAMRGGAVAGKAARSALNERLDRATQELMQRMISDHGLLGSSAAKIEQRVQNFQLKGRIPFDERSGAVAGAVVSGALGGLAADVLSGGLSLGGGLIAGGILGALGGSALAKGYRLVVGDSEPYVRWTDEFLDALCLQVSLRYLAVAHYGRGQGRFRDLERPAHWSEAVSRELAHRRGSFQKLWQLADRSGARERDRLESELHALLRESLRSVLKAAYPA